MCPQVAFVKLLGLISAPWTAPLLSRRYFCLFSCNLLSFTDFQQRAKFVCLGSTFSPCVACHFAFDLLSTKNVALTGRRDPKILTEGLVLESVQGFSDWFVCPIETASGPY
ncbi:hypothetical protein XENOCAPTIV_010448 [Xenoophorus captivus]|uniref:Secreted protein n=1 Tax=Xenoophorus captivus TaxID=1517983 RepID=A0ABV0QLL8_9TELE